MKKERKEETGDEKSEYRKHGTLSIEIGRNSIESKLNVKLRLGTSKLNK